MACTPGAVLIGVAVVLAVVLWHYREIVLTTLTIIGISLGAILCLCGLVIVAIRIRNARLVRAVDRLMASAPAVPEPAQPSVGDTVPREGRSIADLADLLGDDRTNLSFTDDGTKLIAYVENTGRRIGDR
jgi:uncharacterized membrane protein YciS (DUF1049 family)